MKNRNRILSLALAGVMSLSMLIHAFAASTTFTDVPSSHWAYAYIEKAAAEGYVSGVGNNQYNPSGTVTYAEFGTMLVRMFRTDTLDMFYTWCEWLGNDPDEWCEHWYDSYMWAMIHSEMLTNTKADTTEQRVDSAIAESPITRYEMAQIVYNTMNSPSKSEIEAAKAEIGDWASIPSTYQDAVAACYAAGYLSGVDSNGTFSGNSTMDRAQAATVLCRLANLDVDNSNNNSDSGNNQGNETGTVTGSKDANGYTTAASVNGVQNRNKSDAYPTKGNSDTVSVNGYYTGSTVDVGNSVLVYDFLDMVNAARKAEGLNELEWVESDAAEEYTLVRAMDLTKSFSHFGQHAGLSREVIAWGAGDAQSMFDSWMNSEGHRATLMESTRTYMCAARNGASWIITLWDDIKISTCEKLSVTYTIPTA